MTNIIMARLVSVFFYLGLALLFPAILFRIQHWFGGAYLQLAALIMEVIFFLLVIIEIAISKYISVAQKILLAILWGAPFALALIFLKGLLLIPAIAILGYAYLTFIRRKIVSARNKFEDIQFDSI